MKKLIPLFLCAVMLVGCGEPTLETARKAAEKYIKSTNSVADWKTWASADSNTVVTKFTYENYYIDAKNGASQDDLDWWAGLVDTLVSINISAKAAMDETGYIADCLFGIYDIGYPDNTMLQIKNGNIIYNYLDGVTDTFITLDKFNSIKNGMSYRQVVNIIGCEGELSGAVDLGIGDEYATEAYTWHAADGIGNAIITFQGGRVASMAQAGLH